MWKCLKRLWPTKSKKSKIQQINGTSNPLKMAELLNEYLSSIGEKVSKNFGNNNDNIPITQTAKPPIFELRLATYAEVEAAIQGLSASCACGTDGLTSRLIKDAWECIIIPLIHIFNLSINSKNFPTSWKTGTVTYIKKEVKVTLQTIAQSQS